jgi:hypothetical protein
MDKLAPSPCVRSRLPAQEASSFQRVSTRDRLADVPFDVSDPSFAAGAARAGGRRCFAIAVKASFPPRPAVLTSTFFMQPHRVAFIAKLLDYPHATADVVRVSEQRFTRELERQLGEDVVPALRAYQNAYESSGAGLTKDELTLAQRWAKAYDAARTAGFRDLGDTDEAFFEVRPV